MADILEKIVAQIRKDEKEFFRTFDPEEFSRKREKPVLPVLEAMQNEFFLICEIKKASPSKGLIRENFDPMALAKEYAEGGASALSILTEKNFFQGSKGYLREIKKKSALPLLRKDFIVHEAQIYESLHLGADLVLLIAACLDDRMLSILHEKILTLGMTPLVEVHDEEELERVLKINPVLLGINNRDLRTFKVDLETSFRLKKKIPPKVRVISESGIETHEHIKRLREAGFAGALVGESLLRQKDVTFAVRKLMGEA